MFFFKIICGVLCLLICLLLSYPVYRFWTWCGTFSGKTAVELSTLPPSPKAYFKNIMLFASVGMMYLSILIYIGVLLAAGILFTSADGSIFFDETYHHFIKGERDYVSLIGRDRNYVLHEYGRKTRFANEQDHARFQKTLDETHNRLLRGRILEEYHSYYKTSTRATAWPLPRRLDAVSLSEKMIVSDPQLAAMDRQMWDLYQQVTRKFADDERAKKLAYGTYGQLVVQQRQWLMKREGIGESCRGKVLKEELIKIYLFQLNHLKKEIDAGDLVFLNAINNFVVSSAESVAEGS